MDHPGDDDGWEEDEVPVERRVESVIAGVRAFAAGLPIRVELRPYVNRFSDAVQGVVLTDLFADAPGNGVGTGLVREMLRLAGEADVPVYTDADGPRSAAFYRKMGFEGSSGRGHQLVYHPPIPPGPLPGDDEEDAALPFGPR